MLVIRLQRTGRRNIASFRLVVSEKRMSAKGGKVNEFLGLYLPSRNPHEFTFEKERVEHWLKMGATPSNTVARLLKRAGMQDMDRFTKRYTKKKSKNPEVEAAKAPVEAPATPAEAPAEEGGDAAPKGG